MSMFLDQVTIDVKAGKGGDGMVAFRREKYVPDGGPAGGDGGRGGDVILIVDEGLRTLMDFRFNRHFKAQPGENGMSKGMHGRGSEDTYVKVPQGTTVRDAETGALLGDLILKFKDKITILAALDNLHFPAFVMGAHGTLAAIPTITPHLTVKLWNCVKDGNYTEAREIHETILPIWHAIEEPNMPAKIKEALRLQGREAGKAKNPMPPVTKKESEKIRLALKNAGLLKENIV